MSSKILFIMFILISLFIDCGLQNSAWAQESKADISIGQTIILPSKILNENRPIFISVPPGYESSQLKYPVLYIMDGRGSFLFATSITRFFAQNGKAPAMIVVAVPNTFRNRDFTPTAVAEIPGSGGANNFIDFLQTELIPFVEQNYHTQHYRILSGHSMCGLFTIYTFLTNSSLFNAYFAVSPAIFYDNEFIPYLTELTMNKKSTENQNLFITLGNEPTYLASLERFTRILKDKASKKLNWDYVILKDEDHGSIPMISLYKGLNFLYEGWKLTPEIHQMRLSTIEDHYKNLSKRFGYQIRVPEYILNRLGYLLIQEGDLDKAIKFFEKAARMYPGSANVYDSLGNGFEIKGQFDKALNSYQKAVEIGAKENHPFLSTFEKNLKRVESKIKN